MRHRTIYNAALVGIGDDGWASEMTVEELELKRQVTQLYSDVIRGTSDISVMFDPAKNYYRIFWKLKSGPVVIRSGNSVAKLIEALGTVNWTVL